MDIRDVALEINRQSANHPIGRLQEFRRIIRDQATHTNSIFSETTIFNDDDYAFHDGGRHELQFNIGFEDDDSVRYGVAFSLEPSRSHPDLSELLPKIDRFNYYVRVNLEVFYGLRMWYSGDSQRREFDFPVQIDNQMSQHRNFIFIGRVCSSDSIDYSDILSTFDRLLPLYIFVEGKDELSLAVQSESAFIAGHTTRQNVTKSSRSGGVIDVALRHNELQSALYTMLSKEYGANCVREEYPLDCGGRVDIAVNGPNGLSFYEIKVAPSARSAIREALGQLMDYCYWPNTIRAADLVVVAEPRATPDTISYLEGLRKSTSKEIHYRQLSMDPIVLHKPT